MVTAMKRKLIWTLVGVLIMVVAVWQRALAADDGAKAAAPAPGGVHEIKLPAMPVELPPGPGRETAAVTCVICHTTRYITTQPRFSRAAWTAEVDKMRKTFGAPLTDAQAAEVVNYLVAIRGTEAK
jgi:mono/diheme cytochrome c family protein